MLAYSKITRYLTEGFLLKYTFELRELFSKRKRIIIYEKIIKNLCESKFTVLCNNFLEGAIERYS